MNLLAEINKRLERVSDLTIFGAAIKGGIKTDLQGTIQMIADQANDNREIVSRIISEETLTLIEKYLKNV